MRRRVGKTLIELVVVLCIVCILLALFTSTYMRAYQWSKQKAGDAVETRAEWGRTWIDGR